MFPIYNHLKEKKMQNKCIFMVVNDDIESPYKIVPDVFLYKVLNVFVLLSYKHDMEAAIVLIVCCHMGST